MRRKKNGLLSITGVIVVLLGLFFSSTNGGTAVQAAGPSPIEISISATLRGSDSVLFTFTLRNTSSSDVGDVFVAASLPQGSMFSEALGTPEGSWFRAVEGAGTPLQSAVWLSAKVPANGSLGPFAYVVNRASAKDLTAHVWVHWKAPSDGTALSPGADPSINLTALHRPSSPQFNGDCQSCHSAIMDQATLNPKVQEAHAMMMPFVPGYSAAKGVTNENCTFCHSGTDLRDHSASNIRRDVNVASCTACHGPQGPGKKLYTR